MKATSYDVYVEKYGYGGSGWMDDWRRSGTVEEPEVVRGMMGGERGRVGQPGGRV